MGVLLEGLQMPNEIPLTIQIYSDGVWCDIHTTRHGKAAIIPEPHGRLVIEGDEIIEQQSD